MVVSLPSTTMFCSYQKQVNGEGSSSGQPWKYDVFLSFRGEDTRKIFVGHLYRALKQKTISAYIDSEKLRKGNKISELLTAIGNSRLSIVVLSQNYASSTWCLKELVKILECMHIQKHIVVPVFYELDPSDVRRINGKVAQAFAKHGKNSQLDKEELESWRSALTTVADLSGWDSRNYEDDGKLIEEIVENTLGQLIRTSSYKASGLVGMDHHITEMKSKLCLQENDVRVVGIWGMGGLGKTTIARAVYHEIASQFEHSCFLNNVKEAFLNKLEAQKQEELLSRLLREEGQSVDLNRGWNMIIEGLGTSKVLVVLDDVETFAQIEVLLGNLHAFGEGSRVIVTTRNKQSLSGVNETYKPMYLSNDEALQLFMTYAFRTNPPDEDYHHLSMRAINYAQGLPLALKVLGAFLDNKSVCEWEAVLDKLKKIPHIEIQDVLRTSFDGLDDSEKNIFLDIACLFREFNKEFVTELQHSCGFIPLNDLRVLIDRALVSISEEDNSLDMHDLVQEMGRAIVRLKPGNRSRLWGFEDVNDIMTQNMAMDAVECLMLNLSKSKVDLCINTESFVKMTKLRVLIITLKANRRCCQKLMSENNFKFLSHEVRLLLWHGCPLKSFPSSFIPKNLVKLDMSSSDIQQLWDGIKPLQNLKAIELSDCAYLLKIPDLSKAINLERLFLNGCSSLFEVHSSIFALQKLKFLTLEGCKELKILPSSIHMESLKTFNLSGCSNVEKLPEISGVMTKLEWLYLGGTAIKELPSSINNLTRLRALNLKGCKKLKTLSISIHMSSLWTLDIDGCSNLEKFPEISGIMKELPELVLDRTVIKELPSTIDLLLGIKKLSLRNCKSLECLPNSLCNLSQLRHLYLSGCSGLHNLPENLGNLESLQVLDVSYSGIKRLPFSILRFGGRLSCIGCEKMKAPLSAWPSSREEYSSYSVLMHLDLSDCNLLELSDGIAHLSSLKTLKLCRTNLESLPVTMNQLCCLTHLELEACKRLKSIPELSSSINYILADDCTTLNTVSMPKPKPQHRTNHTFTFCNCLQLVQTNLFRDMVERHSHFQDDYLGPLVMKMSLPGSKVPDWFTHRSKGFSVSFHLPENWLNHKFMGFAFCAIRSHQGVDYGPHTRYTPHLSSTCTWTFKGRSSKLSVIGLYDTVVFGNRNSSVLRSDHTFQGYVSRSECQSIENGELVNGHYTKVTFQILIQNVFMTDEHGITRCGVRLVYADQDEMMNLSVSDPQAHVDSCEMGVSAIGACEMSEEVSAISMEVESLESGKGRDTFDTLQVRREQPKKREGEKDTMETSEHVVGCSGGLLSSVCCCWLWMVALCWKE